MFEGYDNNFDAILIDANLIYQKKKAKYGESWKDMTPGELSKRLFEEMEELAKSDDAQKAYNETLDVINVALMLGKRLLEQHS